MCSMRSCTSVLVRRVIPDDAIALLQQELGEIRAVLTRYPGDEGGFAHAGLN